MQPKSVMQGEDFEIWLTDGGKAIVAAEDGYFAHIELLLWIEGIIPEVTYYSTAERVEAILEPKTWLRYRSEHVMLK